jgi:hypothetical protein
MLECAIVLEINIQLDADGHVLGGGDLTEQHVAICSDKAGGVDSC